MRGIELTTGNKACGKALLGATLLMSCLISQPAFASRGGDYISTSGHPIKRPVRKAEPIPDPVIGRQGAFAMGSNRTPVVSWFESFDDMKYTLKVSSDDLVVLKRPFNQQVERVQEWIRTAAKVSKNYRLLSDKLRGMQVPAKSPGLQRYRDLSADWYQDVALVYEDLIRPRPRAKTIEELNSMLTEIDERANSLKETRKDLMAMDRDLRQQFKVHLDKHEDALQQYVRQNK